MRKFTKTLLIVLFVIVLAFGGFLGWLTVTEFNPDPIETLSPIKQDSAMIVHPGASLQILSWNIGYAGLGAESDFFMDGGQNARSADEETVKLYLQGIHELSSSYAYDFVMLQEVDTDSARTYSINEAESLACGTSYHALNFSCPFVPNPKTLFYDPIGRVNSGLLTSSYYSIEKAERISLPCPFSWPLRIANLKRCLLVTYIPIEDSEQYLVLVNLHLEAYDSGEGKIAQTKQLREFIQSEYQKGNYVVAGGDFNQVFPGSLERYPNQHPDLWEPGVLDNSLLPEGDGWSFAYDIQVPTCRLLNQPYEPSDTENTQYYVIDGFIVSPNVQVEAVETLDQGFANSDHNPVQLRITLR